MPNQREPAQMEWIPRWMSPYYDTTSTYRLIWESIFPVPAYQMKAGSFDYTLFSWYGGVSCPRQGYVAKYTSTKQNLPPIILTINDVGVEVSVKIADTIGTFLSEWSSPIAFWDGHLVHFRNIEMHTVSIASSGGIVDLSSEQAIHPMIPDSPLIVLKNGEVDSSFIDATSILYNPSLKQLNVGVSGTFNISYLSTQLKSRILSGEDYITIGGLQVDIVAEDLPNIWDDCARLLGTWRRPDQDNLSLKVVCQHLAVAKTPAQRISAVLEQSWATIWSTGISNTLSLEGSGAVEVAVFGEQRRREVTESPTRDSGDLLLSQSPTRYVQLFHERKPVDPDLFTLTGSRIILDSSRILSGPDSRTIAHYVVDNYSETKSGSFVTQLQNKGFGLRSVLVLFSRNVQVEAVTKTDIDFRWNKQNGVRRGSATFD